MEGQQAEYEEGPRIKHLRNVFRKTIQSTIKQCCLTEKIELAFPYRLHSEQLAQLETIFCEALQKVQKDTEVYGIELGILIGFQLPFEDCLQKLDLPSKLNEIDRFMATIAPEDDAKLASGLQTTRPTAEQIMHARLVPCKQSQLLEFQRQLDKLESDNKARLEVIRGRREAICRRFANVRNSQQLLDLAFNQVAQFGADDMQAMVHKMMNQDAVPFQPGSITPSSAASFATTN